MVFLLFFLMFFTPLSIECSRVQHRIRIFFVCLSIFSNVFHLEGGGWRRKERIKRQAYIY